MTEIPFYAASNLTRDPELRYTNGGMAVANLGLATNPRHRDAQTGKWVDGTPTFLDATVWGPQAAHVAESLSAGDHVVVIGRLVTRTWTPESGPKAGELQRKLEVVVTDIGAGLRWATAKVTKQARQDRDDAPASEEAPF